MAELRELAPASPCRANGVRCRMPKPAPAKAKLSPATYVLLAFSLMFMALALGAVAWLYLIPHGDAPRYKCQQVGDRQVCQGPARLTVRR